MSTIPKIIHYCWFGGNELPVSAQKCIETWKKYMPGYTIKRWDESNFNVDIIPYTKEAYKQKLYAFVSDFARFYILNKEGGIYLDTDVELIKPLDCLVDAGPYMGIEEHYHINPGLGMASLPGMHTLAEILRVYENLSLYREDGSINYDTVVFHITNLMRSKGWTGKEKEIGGFKILPKEFLCPLDYKSGKLTVSCNTYSIHHYSATWITPSQMMYRKIKKLFGERFAKFCASIYKKLR